MALMGGGAYVPPKNPYTAGGYTPPKQPSNSWNWNQSNPLGQTYQMSQPAQGMSTTQPAATSNYMKASGPAMGAASTDFSNTNIATPQPFGDRTMAINNPLPHQDIPTPMPQFNIPTQTPAYQPPGFNTQYATRDNLGGYGSGFNQQYTSPEFNFQADPGYQFRLNQGLDNVQSRLAGRGLIGSGAEMKGLNDYAQGAASQEYGNAYGRFDNDRAFGRNNFNGDRSFAANDQANAYNQMTGDRGYMTGVHQDNRNFGYKNFQDTNAWNYGMHTDERNDWNSRMQNWQNQMNGITNTGIGAAGNAGQIQSNLGAALAQLYGNRGDVGAMQAMQGGANNNSLIGGFLSALFGGG